MMKCFRYIKLLFSVFIFCMMLTLFWKGSIAGDERILVLEFIESHTFLLWSLLFISFFLIIFRSHNVSKKERLILYSA